MNTCNNEDDEEEQEAMRLRLRDKRKELGDLIALKNETELEEERLTQDQIGNLEQRKIMGSNTSRIAGADTPKRKWLE